MSEVSFSFDSFIESRLLRSPDIDFSSFFLFLFRCQIGSRLDSNPKLSELFFMTGTAVLLRRSPYSCPSDITLAALFLLPRGDGAVRLGY